MLTPSYRSIIEPVRNTKFRQSHHFHLSEAVDLDLEGRSIHCRSVLKSDLEYDLKFDKLVIGVGALSNTFGVPGVVEHAFFLKVSKFALFNTKNLKLIEFEVIEVNFGEYI